MLLSWVICINKLFCGGLLFDSFVVHYQLPHDLARKTCLLVDN